MTTYNSYEAAKIANPDSEIWASKLARCGRDNIFGTKVSLAELTNNYFKCNPADHCMTVEKFLADGNKFVEGDVIFNTYPRPTVDFICDADLNNYNELDEEDDDKRYILRAAALEEKPSEKVEWDGEGLQTVGVECWFNFKVAHPQKCKVKYIGKTVCVYESADGNEYSTLISEVAFSKIETEQQREDRQRLEAAYDLYCEWRGEMHESFYAFKRCNHDNWLSIVDKTNYRISK
jgi:hypothetical protein